MTDETTNETVSENETAEDGTAIDSTDVNTDEPAKIRIQGSNDGVEFDIGSSFSEDEILYLKFTDEKSLRQLRDFAEAHLEGTDFEEVADAN
jgi:hypothetical protein